MVFIIYRPYSSEHRNLRVRWQCGYEGCGHKFTAMVSTGSDWAWCQKCGASSTPICEAAEAFERFREKPPEIKFEDMT